MKEDAQAMDEVVVIGYTSKARKDLTGSVGSVSGVKIAAIPVSSAAVALQGKIAGVQVTTVDGAPGADINIRVRGGTSVTQSNEPLYIVDGFQVDNINDIPPTDIASIDVLKDASITAIYGAKGGNGVVVVTTKSAKAGKIQVSLNAHLSTSQLAKKLDLMNAAEFARYQYDGLHVTVAVHQMPNSSAQTSVTRKTLTCTTPYLLTTGKMKLWEKIRLTTLPMSASEEVLKNAFQRFINPE